MGPAEPLTDPAAVAGCTQRAYLYLERDQDPAGPPYRGRDLDLLNFDPDQVTALVGLAPTRTWRRGDPVTRTGRRTRRFGGWRYELPPVRTFDTEAVVTGLLEAVEPYAAGIAEACRTLGMRAGVMVVIWMRGERDTDGEVVVSTPALGYSAGTVARLARLGLAVHHDQYVELPDP